jgi:PadR family transcriptional regulator, regulatory protein PadR
VNAALKPVWYYILVALGSDDRHGQSIAREVHELSAGQVRLWPATLYGALEELEQRGWIEELGDTRRPADESQKRRYYRLTRAGRTALSAETDRLASVVRIARARVKPRHGNS